jgi:hypothetical protein
MGGTPICFKIRRLFATLFLQFSLILYIKLIFGKMQAAMVCNSKGLVARRPTVVFGAKTKQAS